MKILHVASEMAPLAKQGGLGDVLGALPAALRKKGVDARVLLPVFPGVMENARKEGFVCEKLPQEIHVALDWKVYTATVWKAEGRGLSVYLLEQPDLFTNPKIYPMALTGQTALPFVFLSLGALELPKCAAWQPEILHVHDWSTAILPIALRWHRHYRMLASSYDVVLTIHNLAHQGIVDPGILQSWGLTKDAFLLEGMEFYGQANILKGGIVSSDVITTVSPNYSWDIQTEDGGLGLHGVFSSRRGKLIGILNGIDYDIWSPSNDKLLPAAYTADDLAGKAICRKRLVEMTGWNDDGKPIMTFIGRLFQQKGVDILTTCLERTMAGRYRVVLIGSGLPQYESWIHEFQQRHPDCFWGYTDFNEKIAHLAYAGSDILLMPSLFEPCGLSQMIAMSYGTIPVVRSTGGLADTVIDFDSSIDGTGFLFSEYNAEELARAIDRAIAAYADASRWSTLMQNAMGADFSWKSSSDEYIDMYRNLRSGAI